MELQRWISILFGVASIIDSGSAGKNDMNYLFHIPWACSVMHIPDITSQSGRSTLIGAGALIDPKQVLVSVSTFMETVPNSTTPFYQVIEKGIYVHAGANFMDPRRTSGKPPRFMQTKKAVILIVAFKLPQANGQWDVVRNPADISEKAGAEFDAYGLAFAVGILVVEEPFVRSSYLLPMLIKGPDVKGKTSEYRKKLEQPGLPSGTCMTYSWNSELNKIRYHEVSYLHTSECRKVYCNWNFEKCDQFPQKDYLACFKSVKMADVCPNAGGAALYCPSFNNSVFAILTTAPSCGQRNMPGVYTTLPMIIDLFEVAFKVNFEAEKRVPYDLYSLPQFNDDYPGIME